jgi:hypothetical protein
MSYYNSLLHFQDCCIYDTQTIISLSRLTHHNTSTTELLWTTSCWRILLKSKSHCDCQSVSQSVSKSWCRALSGAHYQIFITVWQLRSCFSTLTRGRICLLYMPAQSFLGSSPLGLATIFYSLRFETSLFVASYDSQGHGGGIRSRLHTGSSRRVLTASYIDSAQTFHRKHINCSARISCMVLLSGVSTNALPSNGRPIVAHTLLWYVFTGLLPSN